MGYGLFRGISCRTRLRLGIGVTVSANIPATFLSRQTCSNTGRRITRGHFPGRNHAGRISVPVKRGVRTYDEIIAPICVGDKITGITGVNIDITERKTTEEALRQANRNLALLTNITRHDINNQLVALNGFVDLLHERSMIPLLRNISPGSSR